MAQIVTGKARLSYPYIFTPRKDPKKENDPGKFSCMLMIPKSDEVTMAKLRKAEEAAKQEGKAGKWGGKIPANLKPSIIKDGDLYAEDYPERAGHWFLSVSSSNKPGVVDVNRETILDQSEIYAGCYVRAALNAAPYKHVEGGKGVSFYLNHIQKLADGDPLGNVTRAEDVFAEAGDVDDLI